MDFKTYISKNESCCEGKSKRKTEGLVVLIRYVFILSELMLKKTKEVLTEIKTFFSAQRYLCLGANHI